MDTNVQALKGLYAALGGEASDVADLQTSAEVIVALEAVAEAAATELPAVKKVDEGKVLTVNGNGKWSAKLPESEIDDSEASETKTYSSSKIASLIPANELPVVTSADNGKLLGVSSGAWSAVDDNVIVIPATLTYNSDNSQWSIAPTQEATLKKCDDIYNAIVANKVVRIYAKDGNNGHVFDVLNYNTSSRNFSFREFDSAGSSLTFRYFTLSGYAPSNFSGVLTVKTIAFSA